VFYKITVYIMLCSTVNRMKLLHAFGRLQPDVLQRFKNAKVDHFLHADSIDAAIQLLKGKQANRVFLKPNSITLAGSELVRRWFELDSVMELGFYLIFKHVLEIRCTR